MAIEFAGALAGAIAAYGVKKVGSWLYDKIWGGSKRGRKRKGTKTTTTAGGDQVIELPGGDKITKIKKYDPEFDKYMRDNMKPMMEEYLQKPEEFPELSEIVEKQHEVFGTIPEYQRTELPDVPKDQFDFDPIAAQAMQQFKGEVIPGLAERFTSLTGGGQRSGAFARQTTKAGENLSGSLAALRAQMQPEMAAQRSKLEQARAALGIQQEGEAARLGLAGRSQQLGELGFQTGFEQMRRQPKEMYKERLFRMLTGEPTSPYHLATQPAKAQQPGFLSGIARGGGEAVGKYAPHAIDAALKYYGYSGLPGLK